MEIKNFAERCNAIKLEIPLLSEVKKYIQFEKNESYFEGICSFCSLLNPSFTVNENKNIFYCFNCYKSGDIITFIALQLKISPIEALARLEAQLKKSNEAIEKIQ